MSGKNQIIIAGAGIGGLALALALLQRGLSVRVHEQVALLGEIGAGLQLSSNGTRCLFSLGLEDALRQVSCVPEGKKVRLWNTGQRWKLFDLGAESERSFGYPYLMVHRGDLHHILLKAVRAIDPTAVQTGSRCIGFVQDADGVNVEFDDGHKERCDVLIGSDGVHSQIRNAIIGAQKPVFTGCLAWRGLVPANELPNGFVQPMGVNWIGPGAHVVTYPLRGGELVNFVGIVERDDWLVEYWTEPGSVDECANGFASWHDDVHTLIRKIKQPFKWALMGREPPDSWSRGRITLLGDAAHPTLSFLAQGANMALEDAIVLARCLKAHEENFTEALQIYQELRVNRTLRIVRGSSEGRLRTLSVFTTQHLRARRVHKSTLTKNGPKTKSVHVTTGFLSTTHYRCLLGQSPQLHNKPSSPEQRPHAISLEKIDEQVWKS